MEHTFKHITEILKEYEHTHKKIDIGKKRRLLIKDCYQRLKILEENSSIGVRYSKSSAKIRIVSRSLLSCSQAPALLTLIGFSDICTIKTCRSGFIIDLEFNLWKWVKREICS